MKKSHCPDKSDKECRHPLFSRAYFKENFLSFTESIILLLLWSLFILVTIRFIHLVFVLDLENMIYLIADTAFNISSVTQYNQVIYTGIVLIGLLLLIYFLHLAIDKGKTKFHPKSNH